VDKRAKISDSATDSSWGCPVSVSNVNSSTWTLRPHTLTVKRAFVYVILLAMTCVAAASSGFLNYKEATEFASRDIFYRAWGVEYPSERSPRSAVILFTDKSLGSTGSWPAPYETHAVLLRRLMTLQPAAVMIDIGFIDERDDPTLAQFIDVLKSYHKSGIRGRFQTRTATADQLIDDLGLLRPGQERSFRVFSLT
jgi:hypothetical protein